jgi:hypothetical protein
MLTSRSLFVGLFNATLMLLSIAYLEGAVSVRDSSDALTLIPRLGYHVRRLVNYLMRLTWLIIPPMIFVPA